MNFPTHYSVVSDSLKKRKLFHGIMIALPGLMLLLFMGTFANAELLKKWGAFSFTIGIFLIASGLLPYKRLMRLEMNPHQLICKEDRLELYMRGRLCRTVARDQIVKLEYLDKPSFYGVKLTLKKGITLLPFFKQQIIKDL